VGFVLLSVWPQQFTFLVISGVVMGIGLGSYLAGTITIIISTPFVFPSSFACELTLTLSFFRPNAVDFALATECLPSEESRGTDLAVWNLAMSLPIAFSGPLGGVMLDNGQRVGHALNLPNLGYVGLFASCGFLLALSAFFVRRITVGNPVRRRKPTNGDVPPFRAPCVCVCGGRVHC
jgi:hypothetical protein